MSKIYGLPVGTPINPEKLTQEVVPKQINDALQEAKDSGAFKGDKGDPGETGATPNFTIGSVLTLNPDSNAYVGITGTKENVVLNFAIPKGKDGRDGVDAPSGGTSGSGTLGDRVSILETKVKNMAEDIVYVYECIDNIQMVFQGDSETLEVAGIIADAVYNIRPTEAATDENYNAFKHRLVSNVDVEAYVQSALDALLNE